MSLLRYFKILTGAKGITPEGAPTSTNVDANTQALDVSVKGTINVDKTGLATDTLQTVGNTSLNNIDTNLGAKADAAATSDTGTFSLISLFKRSLEKLTSILTTQTDGSQKTKITDGAGVVNTKQLGTAVTTSDVGLVSQSVIHGQTTGGGGGYVDVKVNPAGKLEVNDSDTQTTLTDGSQVSQIVATEEDGSYPDPSVVPTGNNVKPNIDEYGNLRTRGEALTDELSYRDDFTGNDISADWVQDITGGSYTVVNSILTLLSSTANGNKVQLTYPMDYLPLTFRGSLSISQRIANQTSIIGFTKRVAGVIEEGAYIKFLGTDANKVDCISQSSSDSSDIQTSSDITLPAGLATSQTLFYKIDLSNNSVTFQVSANGISYTQLAQHTLHLPAPYSPLDLEISIENSAIVTNTDLACDFVFINNMNRLQIDQDFSGEPIPSQIVGQVGNVYKNVTATPTGELRVELSGNNVSAFGDINVAELTPVIQIDFVYGILNSLGTGTTANGGTVDTNASRLRIQSGTNTAGSAIYQTVKVAKYRPAQGIDARFTRVYQAGVADSLQETGMGDTVNGYFFGYVGTQFGIIYRNNSVQEFIPQADWNVDPCDGTTQTSFTLDPTKGNAYKIKYPYQGYANVKFHVYNPLIGNYILVHQIQYANTSTLVQVTNPNLSFWSRNLNSGNTTNLVGYTGSVGVFLSGIRKYVGQTGFAYNNKALTAAGGLTNLFTIKNATTFNTVINKSLIRLTSNVLSVGNLGNNQFGYLQLIKNATLGGAPAYTPDNGSTADNGTTITNGQSPVSVDVAGTTVTGGIRVWASNGVNISNAFIDVTEFDIFIAPGETLTFAGLVTANSGLSAVSNYILDI